VKPLRMLDLFAGIGGFSYAGEKLVGGYETVAFCEYDEHAQKVLRKHWPDTEIIGDIRELADDADRFRGLVDIITGGYPCQPFSTAGKRRGDQDDRHLWPEMLRVIKAVRPRWVIGENVAGHITMGLDTVLSDLEGAGYSSRCYVIPAVAADAPHRRDRCWIVAHADSSGESNGTINARSGRGKLGQAAHHDPNADSQRSHRAEQHQQRGSKPADRQKRELGSVRKVLAGRGDAAERGASDVGHAIGSGQRENVADADSKRGCSGDTQRQDAKAVGQSSRHQRQYAGGVATWQSEPRVCRVSHGVPGRVHRLRQLGNSIVPQVAARILYAIREADRGQDAA